MTSHLCEFDVTVHFKATGLLGGQHEYDPYLSVNGTMGEYKKRAQWPLGVTKRHKRVKTNTKLATGEVESSDELLTYASETMTFKVPLHPGELKADETLCFEVFCRTRDFGIKELDERQSPYTFTHNTCGHVQLEVYDLCRAYVTNNRPETFRVQLPLIDAKIVKTKALEMRKAGDAQQPDRQLTQKQWDQYVAEAAAITQKGVMRFDVTFRQFDAKNHQNSVLGIDNLKTHCLHSLASSAFPESLGRPAPTTTTNKKNQGLGVKHSVTGVDETEYQPLLFTSQKGQQAIVKRLQDHVLAPYCRHFVRLNSDDPDPLHAPMDDQIANLQLPLWVGKMCEMPVPTYWSSIDPATREYSNKQMRDLDMKLYGYDGRTERYFTTLLQSSLRRHGISEAKFQQVINTHFSLDNTARRIDPLFFVCEEVVADIGTFAANSAYYTSDTRWMNKQKAGPGKTFSSVMISLDSWDATLMNDEGRGDDCEGMDHAAMHIIRSYYYGRHDLGASWENPLLNSVKLLLHHSVLMDLGGTVTSAFYDTNNNVVELKQDDLPMVGDEMDTRSHCDGHCYGLMCPLGDTIKRLEAGNVSGDVLQKIKAATINDENFKARDSQRQILLLEATGSIEPRILPLDETYEGMPVLSRKKKAERYFIKALRTEVKNRKTEGKLQDLSQMFSTNGLPHYVEKQHPMRRVSSFYNAIVHGSSVDLWKRFDISLSQFAFAKPTGDGKFVYGAKIGDYMRSPGEYALLFPFYDNRAAWKTEVVPLIEAVQHQIPIASFGRYTDEKFSRLHSSFNVAREITTDYSFTAKPETKESREFDALIASVADNTNLAVVHMQTHHWALTANAERTTEFWDLLDSAKGMISYMVLTQHQMPAADPLMEIIGVLDVTTCLTLKPVTTK